MLQLFILLLLVLARGYLKNYTDNLRGIGTFELVFSRLETANLFMLLD